jgi:cytosine/adenosine deaminase-related metal-dependent hydrolase
MIDLLIANGFILTMNSRREIISDGAVAIDNGLIVDVGESEEIVSKYPAKYVIDATHEVVMPGLIDTHGHAGHGLIKTFAENDDAWSSKVYDLYVHSTTERFWYVEGLLSSIERIKFGTTCGVSFLGGGAGSFRCDDPRFAESYIKAMQEAGMRGILGIGPSGRDFPYSPQMFHSLEKDSKTEKAISFDDSLDVIEKVIVRWNKPDEVQVKVAVNRIAPELKKLNKETNEMVVDQARRVRELADEYGCGILAHAEGGTIKFAGKLGLLGEDVVLAHCAGLSKEEISILKRTKTSVAHCPRARSIIRARCPVPELISNGVTVALGSDGNAPDRTFNLFEDLRTAMIIHRTYFKDAHIMPPGKVLEMVTIDAAKALGLNQFIGSIEAGKKADIITLDLFKPHSVPIMMIPHRVAYECSGYDVDTSIINGEIVMLNRKIQKEDEHRILEEAQETAEEFFGDEKLRRFADVPDNFWGSIRY